jgi:hypothetical protein
LGALWHPSVALPKKVPQLRQFLTHFPVVILTIF